MFPAWTDGIKPALAIGALVVPTYVTIMLAYGAGPRATDVGYQPTQPVPYSHALHVGRLGMDCRYCHTTVEEAGFAAIPPTQTCMGCHANVRNTVESLEPLRKSYATGEPVHWVKVHDLPDYVYFNHSAHISRGVGCVSCHGRVDKMEIVHQAQPLSMSWCLECHRAPERHLRPLDKITDMTYVAADQEATGRELLEKYHIRSLTDCSTCHR